MENGDGMVETKLGKITRCYYGMGGYQDVQLGISFVFETENTSITDFWGFWADKPGKSAEWTKEHQTRYHGEVAQRITKLLREAKVDRIEKLVGIPGRFKIRFDRRTNRFIDYETGLPIFDFDTIVDELLQKNRKLTLNP